MALYEDVELNTGFGLISAVFDNKTGITITLQGGGGMRTIRFAAGVKGELLTVFNGFTLILENNITLQGIPDNNRPLVTVGGGTLTMRDGSLITGNTNDSTHYAGGVRVTKSSTNVNGTFNMEGGIISGCTSKNTANSENNGVGGGVAVVHDQATFIKTGGIIYGASGDGNANTATSISSVGGQTYGCAVYVTNAAVTKFWCRNATVGPSDNMTTADIAEVTTAVAPWDFVK
jgi:hypothetical protein